MHPGLALVAGQRGTLEDFLSLGWLLWQNPLSAWAHRHLSLS